MKNVKQMGIWMDHSTAFLMELTNDIFVENTVVSEFTHEKKESSLRKGENLMHNKEQHQQLSYYKKLSDIIKNYEAVILFGPTDAKNELLNILKADHLFKDIKIEVKHSDKMTKNHMRDLVRSYFK
jgi:hypothetical protein